MLAANNGNLFELMKILGHSGHGQIVATYGHLVTEALKATMAAANALLEPPLVEPTVPPVAQGWLH